MCIHRHLMDWQTCENCEYISTHILYVYISNEKRLLLYGASNKIGRFSSQVYIYFCIHMLKCLREGMQHLGISFFSLLPVGCTFQQAERDVIFSQLLSFVHAARAMIAMEINESNNALLYREFYIIYTRIIISCHWNRP